MVRGLIDAAQRWWWLRSLPEAATKQRLEDAKGVPATDPGIDAVLAAGADWFCHAQDRSATRDGGVARHYSLINGWGASYPETTGYIIPTMLELARVLQRPELRDRARRMLDWFVAIQMDGGGFQGGMINSVPKKPVTFNTGQILIGLAAGVREFGTEPYRRAMRLAADWLVETQDPDGCWRRAPTPFAEPGEKAYETHVSWGLLEAARVEPSESWEKAAYANMRWAMTKQTANGWMRDCCLSDPQAPLTHTLGYCLRGLMEAVRFRSEPDIRTAAEKLARGLLGTQRPDGSLPGKLRSDWSPAADWVCLTGVVQIAASWFDLYELTRDAAWLSAARRANAYVRRTVVVNGLPEVRGGVKGSFPVEGDYGTFEYLNWACKFLLDSCLVERRVSA